MTVCAHRIVPHEQLSSAGFVVEVVSEIIHHFFKIVAFADDVSGEVFFAIPFAAEGFLEVVELVVELQVVVRTDIDRGFAVAGALVVGDGYFKVGYRVAQFVESIFDCWSDVEFSEL